MSQYFNISVYDVWHMPSMNINNVNVNIYQLVLTVFQDLF